MIRRDKIFYAASGLSAIGIILIALGYQISLLLFVAAYLLRPTLHEFGLARRMVDERQLEIYSRSGNMAFIIVMLALVGLALWRMARGESANDLITIIGIGYAARSLTGLIMAGEYRRAGVLIIGAAGVFLALFIAAVEGPSIASAAGALVGLIIIGIGLLARKFPKTISIVLAVLAFMSIVIFRLFDFSRSPMAMWMFFVIPVITAAICLYLGSRPDEFVTPRTRKIVFSSLGAGTAAVFTLMVIMGSAQEPTRGYTEAKAAGVTEEVQGIPCSGNVEYYENGTLRFCWLGRADTLSGQSLPAGTGVHFTRDSVLNWCFLPGDMEVQGVQCNGGGHDFQTAFHPNGQLKTAWLTEDQVIQGIPCARFRFISAILAGFHGKNGATTFHDNGQLNYCELSDDATIQGHEFDKGDAVRFDQNGKLVTE